MRTHLPCPDCGSSDALTDYGDHTYCFSCNKLNGVTKPVTKTDYVPFRGISKKVAEFTNVLSELDEKGNPLTRIYQFPNGRILTRHVEKKEFHWAGTEDPLKKDQKLFLQDKFAPGSSKIITVTEGAEDALSVIEMMGNYPVVAVSSSSSAPKEVAAAHDYLNSFDKIYLCLDNDIPGQEAAKKIAAQFDFNKIYHVKLRLKDANDYLREGLVSEFNKTWWAAKRYVPEGIISSYSEVDDIIDKDEKKPSVPYPYETLEHMTYGIRSGEVILLKAPEGIGKTEILRSFEYHLLKTTDANIGIIHLEEGKARMIKGLVGYELRAPIHLPDAEVSNEEIKKTYRSLTKRDDRVHFYTHFGSDDPDAILSTIRFLVASCDCKYIFLDHITMVVTGLQGEDERKALDYLSTQLKMLTQTHDFTLFLVSHVNDEGQTRGSRNISKVADLVINLHRDKMSDIPEVRNRTILEIEKNRFVGKTGKASELLFDPETFTLSESSLPF